MYSFNHAYICGMKTLNVIETPLTRLVAAWKAARELHDALPTPENLQIVQLYERQLARIKCEPVFSRAKAVFADKRKPFADDSVMVALLDVCAYLEFWRAQ